MNRKERRVRHTDNVKNIGVLNQLQKNNPKYFEHILQKNEIIIAFAKSDLGGIEMLELPVCGHCEKPGAWHINNSCYCWACGTETPNAITLYEYLAQELHLSEEDMRLILSIADIGGNANVIDGGLKI